jgi:hypothetical protein
VYVAWHRPSLYIHIIQVSVEKLLTFFVHVVRIYVFCCICGGYTDNFFYERDLKMKKKRERFRLEEKNCRLDVRLTTPLRDRLENFCRQKSKKLTDVITEALEEYLNTREKEQV